MSREVPIDHCQDHDCCTNLSESPSAVASMREEAQRVQRALDLLPNDYRQVIVLRTLEHQPSPEVAQIVGRSEDAVRKLWVRRPRPAAKGPGLARRRKRSRRLISMPLNLPASIEAGVSQPR